jgi:hypothetical protein
MKGRPRVDGTLGEPLRIGPTRWALWWVALAIGVFVFYVALTPAWIGIRVAAWVAEFRSRRRRSGGRGVPA